MSKVRYVKKEEIEKINQLVTGNKVLLIEGNLDFCVEDYQSQDKDVKNKSTRLMSCLVRGHSFLDGNKRTSLISTLTFLKRNKCKVDLPFNETMSFLKEASDKGFPKEHYQKFLKNKVKCPKRQ